MGANNINEQLNLSGSGNHGYVRKNLELPEI
jgi:hypothetical protein